MLYTKGGGRCPSIQSEGRSRVGGESTQGGEGVGAAAPPRGCARAGGVEQQRPPVRGPLARGPAPGPANPPLSAVERGP